MVFQCINISQVPWEVLKTAAFGLGFQHLPRDLANVNAWKTMFDPFINVDTSWRCSDVVYKRRVPAESIPGIAQIMTYRSIEHIFVRC